MDEDPRRQPAGGGPRIAERAALSVTLDVPAGSGYQAIVSWRPTAGSGSWTAFATQTGSFTVSAGSFAVTP